MALLLPVILASGCVVFPPPRYDFGSPPVLANPVRGGSVGESTTIARDGRTQYRILSFTSEEACFLAQLDGPESQRVQGMTFQLRGFESPDADLRVVPSLPSARVAVRGTSSRFQSMPSGGYASPVTVVEVCFAKPSTVITTSTRYIVVGSDYDGTAEHDGVWRLAE